MRRKNPDQTSLFEKAREKIQAKEQRKQAARVRGKIRLAILDFFKAPPGSTFTVNYLTQVVKRTVPDIAPDSPGRIMRLLRAEGLINYKVVSRKDSLYEVLEPEEFGS
jgi:Fe2+ or Zn2+ uptake regulation protein